MALRPWHVIELCAGAGGLGLGLELAVPGARGVAYVEREAAAAAKLVHRMETHDLAPAPVWSDLATFCARPWRGRIHCVASSDPCQPNSVAGRGLGAADDRFLIDQVLRVVDECRPLRVFRENVTGNAAGQLSALAGGLEKLGYVTQVGIFSSAETGNSHRRERLFVMADRADDAGWLHPGPGRPGEDPADAGGCGGELADAGRLDDDAWPDGAGISDRGGAAGLARRSGIALADAAGGGVARPAVIPGPTDSRWIDVLDRWPELQPAFSKEEAESHLRRGFDALADRVDRLRLLGNGVDPVAAAYAWIRLDAAHRERRARERAMRYAA